MSNSLDRPQLKARDSHIRRAHNLLQDYGVEWSPSKVATLVKRYLASPQRLSLEEVVAKSISKQLNRTTSNPKCITYADPTGEEAAFRVDHPQIGRHDDMSKYGTIKETAERYGISQTTVRRYIASGRITAHRVGPRLIRVDLDQVQRELFGNNGTAA
ncbi:excisionase family DNA-binding protein [Mycolicibacterium sp.]|uniref:excisionase family DNA-binding protein n=1 Tax=Mycolicibacterium sp. TaxID=2320850 RepID=UPI003D0B1C7F